MALKHLLRIIDVDGDFLTSAMITATPKRAINPYFLAVPFRIDRHAALGRGFLKRRLGLQLIDVDVTRFFHAKR